MWLSNRYGITSSAWADQSGLSNNGTVNTGATPVTSNGYSGISFNGTSGNVSLASALGVTPTSGLTILARAYFTGTDRGSLVKIGGSNSNGVAIVVTNSVFSGSGNTISCLVSGAGFYAPSTITTGVHSVAVVVSTSGGTARIFIDGVFITSASIGTITTPSASTTIGGHTEGGTNLWFGSTIYDAVVYNSALTDANVLTVHQAL